MQAAATTEKRRRTTSLAEGVAEPGAFTAGAHGGFEEEDSGPRSPADHSVRHPFAA
jgi:hypothetical protein